VCAFRKWASGRVAHAAYRGKVFMMRVSVLSVIIFLSAIITWLICRYHSHYVVNYSLFLSFASLCLSLVVLWVAYTIERHVRQTANKNAIIKLRDKFVNIDMSECVMKKEHVQHATSIIEDVLKKKTLSSSVTKELESCLNYLKTESPQYETFACLIEQPYEILTRL